MLSPPQTNEVLRSAALLGGFLTVAEETGLPLRCLELGSSAGLNQSWDAYGYRLGADGPARRPGLIPPVADRLARAAAARSALARGAGATGMRPDADQHRRPGPGAAAAILRLGGPEIAPPAPEGRHRPRRGAGRPGSRRADAAVWAEENVHPPAGGRPPSCSIPSSASICPNRRAGRLDHSDRPRRGCGHTEPALRMAADGGPAGRRLRGPPDAMAGRGGSGGWPWSIPTGEWVGLGGRRRKP